MVIFSENPRISFPVNMSPKVYKIYFKTQKLRPGRARNSSQIMFNGFIKVYPIISSNKNTAS